MHTDVCSIKGPRRDNRQRRKVKNKREKELPSSIHDVFFFSSFAQFLFGPQAGLWWFSLFACSRCWGTSPILDYIPMYDFIKQKSGIRLFIQY